MTTRSIALPNGLSIGVTHDTETVRAEWEGLAKRRAKTVYAMPGFVLEWSGHAAASRDLEPRIFTVRRDDVLVGLLPLALGREGGMPMLLPLSDSHSNFNETLFEPGLALAQHDLENALFALEPKAEGLWLRCMPLPTEANATGDHPFANAATASTHDVFGGWLGDGFDAHLDRNNGRRKRKRHGKVSRRFERAGGWRVRRLEKPHEAVAALDDARALFAERFAREGIHDPFAPAPVRAFFAAALEASCEGERPVMAIWTLEIAGRTIAFQCAGGTEAHLSLMFTTYRTSEHDAAAPGQFLLHEVISWAAENGYESFDLGRGRESYKQSWCDQTNPLYDVCIPRSARARLWMAAHKGVVALKRRVKESDRLWEIAKTVRRGLSRAA